MSGQAGKLIEFECRGCEFTEFNPDVFPFRIITKSTQGNFNCQGEESATRFNDVDLSELSWYDYDEKVTFSFHALDSNF